MTLLSHLHRFRRRLRLVDGWRFAQRSLWVAAIISLLIAIAGRLAPVEYLSYWVILPYLVWLLLVIGYAQLRPFSIAAVARRVDRELGLHERLSTALAFQSASPDPDQHHSRSRLRIRPQSTELSRESDLAAQAAANASPAMLLALQTDALTAAARIEPNRDFPFLWPFSSRTAAAPVISAMLLMVAMLLSTWLPNPQDRILAERAAARAEAERLAEKIEDLRADINLNEEISAEEKQKLLEELERLAEALKANPGDLEQALADLSQAEKALQERQDPNAATRQAALESLAQQLQQMAGLQPRPDQSAAEAIAEALAALAAEMQTMDEASRQETASELADLAAQSAQAGSTELAQALAALAAAAQTGDAQAAAQAAQLSQQAAAQTAQQLTDQAARQQAAAALAQGRQALAQAAQRAQANAQANQPGGNNQPGQGHNQGQNPGQGQSQGQGQNPGQGAGQNPAQGQPGGGGGSQGNTLPPGQGAGQVGRPQGNSSSANPGTLPPGQGDFQSAPASSSAELFIPGQDTGQGATQVIEGQSPSFGLPNPAIVPYTQLFAQYQSAASQALQQGYIPPALKDYISQYFTQLEPR